MLQKKNIDYRSDYFSYGVTMLHSLIVEHTKGFISEFLRKIPESIELNFSTINAYLGLIEDDFIKNFLKKLVHEDPNERFQSARDIIITLNRNFNQNFVISKFNSDFSFKLQKEKYIIRNSILHNILNNYKDLTLTTEKEDKEINSNFSTISVVKVKS